MIFLRRVSEIYVILSLMKSYQLARPHAILVVGIPGSGKTFFAQHFSETFRAPFIEDRLIMSHVPDEAAADEILKVLLGEIAKTKQTFVYEPLLGDQITRSEFARWARSLNYVPLIIWVQTDEATAAKRARKNGISKSDFSELMRKFNPPHAVEKPVVISGKHTKPSQTRTVLTRLSANHPVEPVQVPPRQPQPTTIRVKDN